MNNVVISIIRTVVPAAVGALISWLVSRGISVPDDAMAGVVAFLTAVLTGAYYIVARQLEIRWPEFGWLLGVPAQPQYKRAK